MADDFCVLCTTVVVGVGSPCYLDVSVLKGNCGWSSCVNVKESEPEWGGTRASLQTAFGFISTGAQAHLHSVVISPKTGIPKNVCPPDLLPAEGPASQVKES